MVSGRFAGLEKATPGGAGSGSAWVPPGSPGRSQAGPSDEIVTLRPKLGWGLSDKVSSLAPVGRSGGNGNNGWIGPAGQGDVMLLEDEDFRGNVPNISGPVNSLSSRLQRQGFVGDRRSRTPAAVRPGRLPSALHHAELVTLSADVEAGGRRGRGAQGK
jgi:hypothetical protein